MCVLNLRDLGITNYPLVYQRMREFTDLRSEQTIDEMWITEHHSVFTQGLAGKSEHLLHPAPIPVIATDRGGQVTYHGPGQLVIYCLLNIRRADLAIRPLINTLERSMIAFLECYSVIGAGRPDAPGVYVRNDKIASLGLRIRRGACYHGISLNIDNDLAPFTRINPCGFPGMKMTRLADCLRPSQRTPSISKAGQHIAKLVADHLGYRIGATLSGLPEFSPNAVKSK